MTYTCADYRLEMQLAALSRRLHTETLDERQVSELRQQIKELKEKMGMGEEA